MSVLRALNTPIFAAEGIPENVDFGNWHVSLEGMIDTDRTLSLEDIKVLPHSRVNCRLTSVSGWSVRAEWEGVLWRDFVRAYPPGMGATHATFTSSNGYTTAVSLELLDHPRVLLAWGVGGEQLEIEYGGPLRMVIPILWGYKSCKWMVKITYADHMITGFWESRGYTLEGTIEPGETFDVNTQRRRSIQGGEVTEF